MIILIIEQVSAISCARVQKTFFQGVSPSRSRFPPFWLRTEKAGPGEGDALKGFSEYDFLGPAFLAGATENAPIKGGVFPLIVTYPGGGGPDTRFTYYPNADGGDGCGAEYGGPPTPGLGIVPDEQTVIETLRATDLGFWQTAMVNQKRPNWRKLSKNSIRLNHSSRS